MLIVFKETVQGLALKYVLDLITIKPQSCHIRSTKGLPTTNHLADAYL